MRSTSIRHRFFTSIIANGLRAGCSFFSGIVLARGLHPEGYGDLTFLLGSFAAYRSLLDFGASNAFYTFISSQKRSFRFYAFYFGWLGLQFAFTAAAIAAILPQSVVAQIWLGHPRGMVLLAFTVAFFQQPLWQAINQIGEATRKTFYVQTLNIGVALGQMLFYVALVWLGRISVEIVLWVQTFQYILMLLIAWSVLASVPGFDTRLPLARGRDTFKVLLRDYLQYCQPLLLFCIGSFLYDFADKWLLQRIGGSGQQGIYQIGCQFSVISLLATTSILNILWKEVAEARALGNAARVAAIYRKASRSLTMTSAAVTGLLVPWSRELVLLLFGPRFGQAGLVLAIMLFYPVHQSIGQICGTTLLASGETRIYSSLSLVVMLVSIPCTFVLLAPANWPWSPGLALGAPGLAAKVVVLNVISVNLMSWVIAVRNKWQYDWQHQFLAIGSALLCGCMARALAVGLTERVLNVDQRLLFAIQFALDGVIYVFALLYVVRLWPQSIGMERLEVRELLTAILAKMRAPSALVLL